MTNIVAKIFRLTIGGVDWSDYCTEATLQWSELDLTTGVIFAKGKFTLDVSTIHPLPTYRRNPNQWAKGTPVLFETKNSAGAWVTPRMGKLFIAEVPKAPSAGNPQIELDCCCVLSLFDFSTPDGDGSGVTAGVSRDRQTIIASILGKQSIPNSFTSIPYPLNYPIPKSGGSWVEQAGKVAGSASHFLWQDNTGNVVNKAIALNPTAIQTITIGQNESEWEPSEGVELPPEKLIVSGVTYTVIGRNGVSNVQETTGYKRDVAPALPPWWDAPLGVIERTTVTRYPYDETTHSQSTVTTVEQCKITIQPEENYYFDAAFDLVIASRTTDTNYYGDRHQLIKQVCVKEQTGISLTGLVPPQDYYTLVTSQIITTEYTYTAALTVSALTVTDRQLKGVIRPFMGAWSEFFDMAIAKYQESTWTKLGANEWLWVKREKIPYCLKYPDSGWFAEAYSLVPSPVETFTSQDGTGAPPQTQYLSLNDLIEVPLNSCVYFQGLEANPYGDRSQSVTVEYAISGEQLTTFGQNYNALIWGRRYGWRVGLAISDALLSATPLSRVNVVDGGETYGLLMDGLTFAFSATESFATFNGIEISLNSTPSYQQKIIAAANMTFLFICAGDGAIAGNILNAIVPFKMTGEGLFVVTTGAMSTPIGSLFVIDAGVTIT